MGNLLTANVNNSNNSVNEPFSIMTWNGAKSYESVNDPLVELFFKSVRDIPCKDYRSVKVKKSRKERTINKSNVVVGSKTLEEYFDASWKSDQLRTLKFVFYLRDCRGGKGEKKLFRALIRHMREQGLEKHIINNMEHIPTFGSWKDISLCFFGTELEHNATMLIASQLNKDIKSEHPSLCAKYAPSEGGAIDRAHHAVNKISAVLVVSRSNYRKKYLVPLRKQLNIVESQMCKFRWDEIKYEKVPSVAGTNYKKAFAKHDEQRYTEYLKSVQSGTKKMNTSVLMPYQLVAPYLSESPERDETIEAQWASFIKDRREKWPKELDVLPLIDVSGSMFNNGQPQAVHVSVSLGMIFSLLNTSEYYKRKFISFHETPMMESIRGYSLLEMVDSVKSTKWGGSTNFQSAFDLILNTATMFNVKQEDMPKILLVLSDMQFNEADRNKTNWNLIEEKYEKAGYKRPTIIFWNLNGNSVDYPVPSEEVPNCALLSGFNDAIMYSILDGKVPNPKEIVHKALDNERYNVIQLA